MNKLENLKYEYTILYNGGSLVHNNTVSNIMNGDRIYYILGIQNYLNNDDSRISFIIRKTWARDGDELKYGKMILRYHKASNTFKVINNGGILYFLSEIIFN